MVSITKDGPKGAPEPDDKKEPEGWEPQFLRRAKELLSDIVKTRQARDRRGLLTKEKIAECYRNIKRGAETKRFIESDFWKEYFGPFLSQEQIVQPWKPGDAADHQSIVSRYLAASGKSVFSDTVLRRLEDWIKAGEDAKMLIARDEEKRRILEDDASE